MSWSQARKEVIQMTGLPETRRDLGYNWLPLPLDVVLGMFGQFLERNNAEAYLMDVYASNNSVYRNLLIVIPHGEVIPEEQIHIQFDREAGRQFYVKSDMKEG